MKFGEIAKARTTLLNAGTTFDRNQLRATLMSHLAKDVETLGQRMATVRSDYRRKLERWRTQEVPENVWVSALPSDMHDSRLYRMTGSSRCSARWRLPPGSSTGSESAGGWACLQPSASP